MRDIFFACGPSKKVPNWNVDIFNDGIIGRSHLHPDSKKRFELALLKIKKILGIPDEYFVVFTPGSGSGAIASAILNCLCDYNSCELFISDYFAKEWAYDIKNMGIACKEHFVFQDGHFCQPKYLKNTDKMLVYAETTLGCRFASLDFLETGSGIVLVDAVCAAFLEDIPWKKLDAVAFSLQKILGVDAGMGILVLSPKGLARAMEPKIWPIPRLFNIRKWGIEQLLSGRQMSTPSILSLIELEKVLFWIEENGGLEFLRKRNDENWSILNNFLIENSELVEHCIKDKDFHSKALACLRPKNFVGNINEYITKISSKAEQLRVFDVANFANPSWRFWLGPMQSSQDIEEGFSRFFSVF